MRRNTKKVFDKLHVPVEDRKTYGYGASKFYSENPIKNYFYTGDLKNKTSSYLDTIERYTPLTLEINDTPVGVTEDGCILCVPNRDDPPTYAITGSRGKGKSLLLHRLVDEHYNNLNYNCLLLNDYLLESQYWSMPQRTQAFWSTLKAFNEKPAALPIVALVPVAREKVRITKCTSLNFSIDWQDFLESIDKFVELDKALPYFKNMEKFLQHARNIDQVMAVIDNTIDSLTEGKKGGKGFQLMRAKLKNIVMRYYTDKVFGFQDTTTTRVYLNEQKDSLIIALLKINVIPSLITLDLVNKDYFPNYFYHLADSLYYSLLKDPYFKNKRTLVFIEELSRISSVKQPGPAIEILKRFFAQGRMARLSTGFAAQNISNIDPVITTNCNYHFVFNTQSSRDLTRLQGDLGFTNKVKKKIQSLETFEFIAHTRDHFVMYDTLENRKYKVDNTYFLKCRLIPPTSFHNPPGGGKDDIFEKDTVEGNQSTLNYGYSLVKNSGVKLKNKDNSRDIFEVKKYGKKDKRTINYCIYKANPTKPTLYEFLDYRKAVYNTKLRKTTDTLDYDEVKSKGWFCQEKKGIPYRERDYPNQSKKLILRRASNPTLSSYPLEELPKETEIRFNPEHRTIILFGKDTERVWHSLEVD